MRNRFVLLRLKLVVSILWAHSAK